MARYDILFAVMAVQEVRFFSLAAQRFRDEGFSVAFLTFHEGADAMLDRMEFKYFSLHKMKPRYLCEYRLSSASDLMNLLQIDDVESLIRHEMLWTNRTSKDRHLSKAAAYGALFLDIIENNEVHCIVQELGGFIAPQCLYRIARKKNIPHVFIEPSIFNQRIVFTLNDIYSDLPAAQVTDTVSGSELSRYLQVYRECGMLVMPHKDKHFFHSMALRRIFSYDNFKRLARKLHHKYLLGNEEEYNAIGWYVANHMKKWFQSKYLMRFYEPPRDGDRYVFYPFHVPLDFQLTVRCSEYLDQLTLVERLAASLPNGVWLYVKEHPAAIGAFPVARLRRVLRQPNVKLIHPRHSAFTLIRDAQAVVSINSKVGMEAIMQGKPVLVLGETYYRGKGVTRDWNGQSNLTDELKSVLAFKPDKDATQGFIERVWSWSYPGELYEFSGGNVENFYWSLHRFLQRNTLLPSVSAERARARFGLAQ